MNQQFDDEQLIDLRDLVHNLGRYKWGIVGVVVATIIVATLVAFSLTPIYRATATILIESRINRPVQQVQDVYDPVTGSFEYYGTQFEILQSRDLARKVIEKLGLASKPEFTKRQTLLEQLNWRKWLPFVPSAEKPVSTEEREAKNKEWMIDEFSKRLMVEAVGGTQLMKVHFESRDPQLAAQVANTLADLYIESALEGRLSMTEKATSWLTEKLEEMSKQLAASEQALQTFREQENLVNVGGDRTYIETQLTDNTKRLRDAQKVTTDLASTYQIIKQAGDDYSMLENINILQLDPIVQKAKENMIDVSAVVKQLEPRYGPKHPEMIAAKGKLAGATTAYHQQLVIAGKGVQSQYEIARDIERTLGQAEESSKGTIIGLDRKAYELHSLERDVEANRQLYNTFQQRFKETDVAGNYQAVTARVVDPATAPIGPFKPEKRKIILLSTIGGLFLGLLLAALSALFTDIVRSSEDLEALTGLSVLGVLPIVDKKEEIKDLPAQMQSHPKSGFSEGIRSVRTGVLLSEIDTKKKRLVVTSSVPNEGKTTIAINLAIALGQIERVLLLEGDLRRPAIAKQFGIAKDAPGLTDTLAGRAELDKCIYRYEQGKIDILPIGAAPPNPAELLASGKFHQLVDTLSARYDRIVIDSAPCHAVSDTYLLGHNCDGLLFVVKADVTSRRMVRSAIRHLRQAHVPMLGTIINQVDLKRHGHFYGTYYLDYGYYA